MKKRILNALCMSLALASAGGVFAASSTVPPATEDIGQAAIDYNISVVRGQQNVPVRIVIPSSDSIFATGSYAVLCNITVDDTASSSSAEAES